MALQMDDPLAGKIAKFAGLDRVQPLLAGEEPVDRIETSAVAPMDRHALIPIAPVGLDKCADIAHGAGSGTAISLSLALHGRPKPWIW